MCVTFSMLQVRGAYDPVPLGTFDDNQQIPQETFDDLFSLMLLDKSIMFSNMLTLIILNFLLLRYLLMYFPQLAYMQQMVRKVAKVLVYVLLLVFVVLGCFGVMFYAMYSQTHFTYRNILWTVMSIFMFANGAFQDWQALYAHHP